MHTRIHLNKTKEGGREETLVARTKAEDADIQAPSFPFKTSMVYTPSPVSSYKVTRVEEAAAVLPGVRPTHP